MMEIGKFEIGLLIVGIVEVFKLWGVNGKWSLGIALGLGLLMFGYGAAAEAGLISEVVATWVTVIARAIGYTLAVPGLYKLGKRATRMPDSG